MLNDWISKSKAEFQVFPVRDSNAFGPPAAWKKCSAYYFTGLKYRMLVCPCVFAADELLIERPGLYLKTQLPLGGLVCFPTPPEAYGTNNFHDDLDWMVDSYLFKFNSTRPPSYIKSGPRYYVDYAHRITNHGPNVFDNTRVIAEEKTKAQLDFINQIHSTELFNIISSNPEEIKAINYAETSLIDEVCNHMELLTESLKYTEAIAKDEPEILNRSSLTCGYEPITCSKQYNRVVLSFYMAAMKEPVPNSFGSYIGMYKNFYNVLEYLMEGEGEPYLKNVLKNRISLDNLKDIIRRLKSSAPPQSLLLSILNNGETLSSNCDLPPLSENDSDLAEKIAHRLYTKRNAALHSKKTFKGKPNDYNIKPGPNESSQLYTDIAIIRPIAEMIVESLDPNE